MDVEIYSMQFLKLSCVFFFKLNENWVFWTIFSLYEFPIALSSQNISETYYITWETQELEVVVKMLIFIYSEHYYYS